MLVQLSFQINSSDDSHLDSEISRGFICSPNAVGGPVLESCHMREQKVPHHPKHTTHWATKRTHTIKGGRKRIKKKKKKWGGEKKNTAGSFHAPADRHIYINLLEHRTSATTLQPYSWRVHITCFPFESTFPRTLAFWHAVGKLKGKKVFTFWRKHGCLQSPGEMSTANGNEEEEAMRHYPYCRKQPIN